MDAHVHLRAGVICLILVGFWPMQFTRRLYNTVYKIFGLSIITVYVIFLLSQYIEACILLNTKFENVLAVLTVNILFTFGLIKIWVVRKKIIQILVQKVLATEKSILGSSDTEIKTIYAKSLSLNSVVTTTWIVLSCICMVFYCITPKILEILEGNAPIYETVNGTILYPQRPLMFSAWVPLIGTNTILSPTDGKLFLATFALGQIKLVQHQLKKAIDDAKDFRNAIIYHKAIILFVEELSDAMKIFLLLDYLASGIQIAVIGFQAAVTDVSFQLFNMAIYLLTMLMQLFLFYWFGNEILLESMDIGNSIWESNWYTQNKNVQKTLLIVMARTRKPLTLSVGPLCIVSTQTMMTILRVGYSYATLMHRLYS